MSKFPIHTAESHPDHAAEIIGKAKAKYGFVPNLLGAMAESPSAAGAYLHLGEAVRNSSLTPEQRHVVWFTINTIHGCDYCMAAHTGVAKSERIADDVIDAARSGKSYADPKLQALKEFTTKMVLARGWVAPDEIDAFLAEGYTRQTVIDIILAISHKVLSNYTNHVVETPVDEPFAKFAWTPAQAAAE